jgi:large subunit ribosomal protein L30e
MDSAKEIRRAVDTGKVAFGYKQCKKEILAGRGKLVIAASTLQPNEKETLKHIAGIEQKKYFEYPDTGLNLGSICGKPFVVSAMLILDEGKSKVLEV